jgi:RHS repeat-associated protein
VIRKIRVKKKKKHVVSFNSIFFLETFKYHNIMSRQTENKLIIPIFLKGNIVVFWILSFLMVASTTLKAAESTPTQWLFGSFSAPIAANAVVPLITDDDFQNGTTAGITYTMINNSVVFELNRDSIRKMPLATFRLTARVEVSLWYQGSNPAGAASAIILEDLIIDVDTVSTNISDFRAFKNYKNALKMSLKVVSITSPQAIVNFPALKVGGQIHINKIKLFNCATPVTGLAANYNATSGRIAFLWSSTNTNADDFDLEWNYYEDSSSIGRKIQALTATPAELAATFRFDATRVTTSATTDTISALYRKGFILCRVRKARLRADGSREFSVWSTPITVTISATHEATLNWQSDFTFAEDAKKVSMIKYFDGTLRERQAVTFSIANKTTIASQTIYDFNGRPAIKTMPIPTLTDTIRYTPNLATTNGTLTYSKINFDTLNTCGYVTPAMNNTAFWSRYYSINNPEKTTLKGALVPDAEGFHYMMTEFTQDNTGRIRRQSGVGATFKMGGTKETQYFYGKPAQEELDRLFGTEVGYASHYQKNMVQDPNGQLSVSYVDAHGRTVATALAGAQPTTLDAVEGILLKPALTRNILNNVRQGDSLISTYSLLVSTTGPVRILYALDSTSYKPGCTQPTVCYDCQYETRIQITDACAGASSTNALYKREKKNFNPNILFDTLCSTLPVSIRDTLTVTLTPGEYVVTKILKINRSAIDYYADNFVKNAACVPSLTTIQNQMRNLVDGSGCFTDCKACQDSLGTEGSYLTTYIAGITAVGYKITAEDTLAAKNSYRRIVEDCAALCGKYSECESLLNMMQGDMSPSGQYGLYKLVGDTSIVALDTTSIFAQTGGFNVQRYKQLTGGNVYRDALNNPDTVLINGVKKLPTQLTPTEFISNWKISWSKALVNQHPEYCYYTNCTQTNSCNSFDSTIIEIDTYKEAVLAGVIDTAGKFLNDPCFSAGGPGFAFKDSISNWLYVNAVRDPTACNGLGMLGVVNYLTYDAGITFGQGTRADNDQAWLALRGLYMGYKHQLKSRWRALACPNAVCVGNGQAICGGGTNHYKDKQRVWGYMDSLSANGSVQGLLASAAADSLQLISDCDSTCTQLADQWLARLSPCALTVPQQTTLRARLIAVCKGGCDQSHPYGSSSTKNSILTTFGDSSFTQALTFVIGAKTLCDTCNANLINFPGPYYAPVYASWQNAKKKSEYPCLYANLTAMEATYNALPQTKKDSCYKTFSDYLALTSEYPLSKQDIDTLKFYFNPAELSHFLPYEIYIPPYLECNTCKTCAEVQTFVTQFGTSCPNTNDFIYWDKLARYVNNKLGFMLSGEDYYRFINETCAASPPSGVCVGDKRLCPKSLNGYSEPDTACVSTLLDQADIQAQLRYTALIDSTRNDFKAKYLAKCLQALERLTLTDTVWEYHYTLYYYDQAGNLAKTVPPAGVTIITSRVILDSIQAHRNAQIVNVPSHTLPSQYAYNTLNKVIVQKTPDADTSKFWYDRIGRLVVSRDGRQKPLKKHSYTQYDALGRVFEVGEITKTGVDSLMTDLTARDSAGLAGWLTVSASTTKAFITRTFYDDSTFYLKKPLGADRQDNLRNRVASTTIRQNYNGGVDSLYDYATHYSYDVTGNVKTVIQDIKELQVYNQRFKRMDYNYDQLSGKVNAVFYQKDSIDQFAHYYSYDADNRLMEVSTSTQLNTYYRAAPQSIWRFKEATYEYYKHGPLARTELGTMRVQGLDYAYTLQGWLKGVNGIVQTSATDMGQDGLSTNATRKYVGRDAYGFVLNYYTNDYKAAGTTTFDPDVTAVTKSAYYNSAQQLFNGNIRSMTVAIKKFGNANGYVYGYDQLNRIKKMDTWNSATAGALPATWTANAAYRENISYDPNGNIMKYLRHANTGVRMDSLSYKYKNGTNQLVYIKDSVPTANFTTDIDNQANLNNYVYDGIGNLVSDVSEGLGVTWSPYGKVLDATRTGIKTLYGYDAMQNRVVKTFIQATDTTRSYYIRDAQGNTMAVYTRRRDTVTWTEQHLYGSSRLGIWESNLRLTPSVDATKSGRIQEGQKRYELTNHLGNVLVTVNDRRKGTDSNGDGFFDVYDGVEITATDYYPFGLEMAGRSFQAALYRYGFNGKENDRSSWSSTQLVQDYGMRLYNPAIGKFLSVDPIHDEYPELTPYQFASNSPMLNVDFDGLEATEYWNKTKEVLGGIADGLKQLSHDLAPIRPADENDPKTLKESLEQLKSIPQNIKNIPSTLRKVYTEGTLREKVKATVAIVGTIASLKSGGPKGAMVGVVKNANEVNKLGLVIAENLKKATKNKTVYETVTETGQTVETGVATLKGKKLAFHIDLPTALQGSLIGSEVFSKAIKKYNPKAVLGNWINFPGLDANFNAFKDNLAKGMTETEAAANTPTGRMAKNNGFSVPNVTGNSIGHVMVEFTKPIKQ